MAIVVLTHKGGGPQFDAKDEQGHEIRMDSSPDHGGENYGVRPMQTLLAALGGCSGVDIVSILKKQRIVFSDLQIAVSGERERDKVPALWKQIHLTVSMHTEGDANAVQKALHLSIEKYCSVAETLRRAGAVITYELKLL